LRCDTWPHVVEFPIRCLSIGVIGEHTDLQRWYAKLGFVIGDTRRFAHLPFSVTYMTFALHPPGETILDASKHR